ncbi:MAG: hypothetical protein NTW87_25825, partial [Planctomycetota bacterium]|nr:hypothetical protein [Planctomycetota bacterium]
MSNLRKYVEKRKRRDPSFARGFESGYEEFKIGVMLRDCSIEIGHILPRPRVVQGGQGGPTLGALPVAEQVERHAVNHGLMGA